MSVISQLKKISFKRLTSGGKFIPEIDGLRFIAVISVVLFHLNKYFVGEHSETSSSTIREGGFVNHLLNQGNYGVEIFFIISGFILAIPFIKIYSLKKGELNLKKYFTRRLTRLEPPYFFIMIGMFILVVVLTKTLSFQEGLKSLGCSLLYIHNFVYGNGTLPLLNGVAWSLEIEVQFYILAPVLSMVFLIPNKPLRRGIIILVGLIFSVLGNIIVLPFNCLFYYVEFFAIGFLLADLYVHRSNSATKKLPLSTIGSLAILLTIFLLDPIKGDILKFIVDFAQLILLFIFFYGVLFMNSLPAMRFRFITNIGGMCYTVYLLNTYVIAISGDAISKISFSNHLWINNTIYTVFILFSLLVVSSIFFLLIERPCMDKDWPTKLKQYIFKKVGM